jgi:RND superfamily putative drug exporter
MLAALARLATRRPKRVLAATFAVFLVAVVFGGPVAGLLNDGDAFSDPDAESLVTAERLADAAGANPRPSYVALVRPSAPVGSAAGRRAVRRVERELESVPEVARAVTASEAGERALVSRDGRSAVVLGFLRPRADEGKANDAVVARLGETPGVTLGGGALTGVEVGEQVGKDLARAEMIAFPILFLLSLFVFRSVVAALLPLFVGVLTIFGTFLGLRLVNEAAELSIFALNLTIALGLGLAIDYSLFVVSRYREEVARTGPGVDAVRATLGTAGRTVIFSALTVATALLSLVVFPQQFLYSMGIAGALAALLAGAVSLVALPALLAVLGPRVDALALPGWRRHTANPAA